MKSKTNDGKGAGGEGEREILYSGTPLSLWMYSRIAFFLLRFFS